MRYWPGRRRIEVFHHLTVQNVLMEHVLPNLENQVTQVTDLEVPYLNTQRLAAEVVSVFLLGMLVSSVDLSIAQRQLDHFHTGCKVPDFERWPPPNYAIDDDIEVEEPEVPQFHSHFRRRSHVPQVFEIRPKVTQNLHLLPKRLQPFATVVSALLSVNCRPDGKECLALLAFEVLYARIVRIHFAQIPARNPHFHLRL